MTYGTYTEDGGAGLEDAGGLGDRDFGSRRLRVCSNFWIRVERRSKMVRMPAGMITHSSQWKRVARLPLIGDSNCLPQARQVRMRVAG